MPDIPILKGGRFVALGSGLLQVVKHLKFSSTALLKQTSDSVEQTILRHLEQLLRKKNNIYMSSEEKEEQITVEPEKKVEKVKDPAKVAAGKRLVEYHKKAKKSFGRVKR